MENKINTVTWEMFDSVITNLVRKIKKDYKADIIVSIVRGGMIPSVILSHKLEIRNVENIIVKETINDSINATKITPLVEVNPNMREKIAGKNVLLIDDIVGSGETMKLIRKVIGKCEPRKLKTVSCYVNEENWEKRNGIEVSDLVDYVGAIVRGWVIFPWENIEVSNNE